jgi:hypothetical protein
MPGCGVIVWIIGHGHIMNVTAYIGIRRYPFFWTKGRALVGPIDREFLWARIKGMQNGAVILR